VRTEVLEPLMKVVNTPLKTLPLSDVIESISGYKVIPFEKEDPKNQEILKKLKKAADLAGKSINEKGIVLRRANEVGNHIEPFVKEALINVGFNADIPKTKSGKKQAAGYPDLAFWDEKGFFGYLECKTYNFRNLSSNQRTFYLSPSKSFKITRDAPHLIISYEIYVDGTSGNKNIYKCKKWKILTAENLPMKVKHEFNSSNRNMYSESAQLSEGVL